MDRDDLDRVVCVDDGTGVDYEGGDMSKEVQMTVSFTMSDGADEDVLREVENRIARRMEQTDDVGWYVDEVLFVDAFFVKQADPPPDTPANREFIEQLFKKEEES